MAMWMADAAHPQAFGHSVAAPDRMIGAAACAPERHCSRTSTIRPRPSPDLRAVSTVLWSQLGETVLAAVYNGTRISREEP